MIRLSRPRNSLAFGEPLTKSITAESKLMIRVVIKCKFILDENIQSPALNYRYFIKGERDIKRSGTIRATSFPNDELHNIDRCAQAFSL